MNKITFSLLSFALLFAACSENVSNDENVVARFGDSYLLKEHITHRIPASATAEDSAEFIKKYIKSWGMRHALLEIAENNINRETDEIEEQVERFRSELYIDKYEELFVQQKLDTIVTVAQLDSYYAKHKTEFILQYDVVQPLFIVLPKQYVTNKLRQNFLSKNVDDLDQLKDLCYKYSTKFYLDEKWVILEQLKQEIPKTISTQELLNSRGLIVDIDNNVYFIKITNHISAGNSSPREMVDEKIAANILFKRRIDLLNSMRARAFQDAERKDLFEVFYKTPEKQ